MGARRRDGGRWRDVSRREEGEGEHEVAGGKVGRRARDVQRE